ncbi:MAG: hypothetical protein HYU36_13360 [Planctomycetes bacterium]|nr:hypothetical protein [Planctomycetota bacterium]
MARTGSRSIEIRTWQPDPVMEELRKTLSEEEFWKKFKADPEATRVSISEGSLAPPDPSAWMRTFRTGISMG